jgi:hypothetical protein
MAAGTRVDGGVRLRYRVVRTIRSSQTDHILENGLEAQGPATELGRPRKQNYYFEGLHEKRRA